MAQYFNFVNTTRRQRSEIPLPFNFGLSWATNLQQLSPERLDEIFAFVRRGNGWEETDAVMALGDYGDVVYAPPPAPTPAPPLSSA